MVMWHLAQSRSFCASPSLYVRVVLLIFDLNVSMIDTHICVRRKESGVHVRTGIVSLFELQLKGFQCAG